MQLEDLASRLDLTCSPLPYPPPTQTWLPQVPLAPESTENTVPIKPSIGSITQALVAPSLLHVWLFSYANAHMHVYCELRSHCSLKPTLIWTGDYLGLDSQASPQPNLVSVVRHRGPSWVRKSLLGFKCL